MLINKDIFVSKGRVDRHAKAGDRMGINQIPWGNFRNFSGRGGIGIPWIDLALLGVWRRILAKTPPAIPHPEVETEGDQLWHGKGSGEVRKEGSDLTCCGDEAETKDRVDLSLRVPLPLSLLYEIFQGALFLPILLPTFRLF
ncbi:hypothetical protein VNO77_42371 [Canavalia gladiata]|uniref:Uncharacterized protein n=1 Tax=Canavalia gladiata TaxID=3824 RepID=A0AAN9K0J0_CANGL